MDELERHEPARPAAMIGPSMEPNQRLPAGAPQPAGWAVQATPSGQGKRDAQLTMDMAAALAKIRDLVDEGGRTYLIHLVGDLLGRPLLLPGHANPKAQLYDLVLHCREIPGGLQALVNAVEFMAGHTAATATVRRLVSPAHDPLEPKVQRQIQDLLEGFTVPSLARLYHTAAAGLATAPRQPADAWDAFCILLDANAGPDGLPPCLLFVELLVRVMRHRAGSGASSPHERQRMERLREWMTTRLAELRENGMTDAVERLARIRDGPGLPIRPDTIYLIIQLEPLPRRRAGDRLYRLSHWRQFHPLEWRPEPGEDREVTLREVAGHVAELVQEAEEDWAYALDDTLVLEFVLPLQLLNLPLDEWTRDPPDMPHPTPLGSEYEVLVRSHDRLHTRHMHRAWRQRWRMLTDDMVECATHWAVEDCSDPRRLRDRLLIRENVVACVLSSPPDRQPGQTEVLMALRMGIPIMLWSRSDQPPPELDKELRAVMGRPDHRLPGNIRVLRNMVSDIDEQAKPQLTLLWDDPTHFLDNAPGLHAPRSH